jgi:hypothetical protein
LLPSRILTLFNTKRHLLRLKLNLSGNLDYLSNLLFSIVMEYADNGDLFQKITEHQKNKTTFNEQDIWKIFI